MTTPDTKSTQEIKNVRLISEKVLACDKSTITWDWVGYIPEVKLQIIRRQADSNGKNRKVVVEDLTKEAISNQGTFDWQTNCTTFGDNHYVVITEALQDSSDDKAVVGKSDYFTVLGVHFLSPTESSVWSIWEPENTIYWEDTTPFAERYQKDYGVLFDNWGEYIPLEVAYPKRVNCYDLPHICPDIYSNSIFSTTWQPIMSFTREDLEVSQ